MSETGIREVLEQVRKTKTAKFEDVDGDRIIFYLVGTVIEQFTVLADQRWGHKSSHVYKDEATAAKFYDIFTNAIRHAIARGEYGMTKEIK